MIRPLNASPRCVFYYSEEMVEDNKLLSGWSIYITYKNKEKHYEATYCKYFNGAKKTEKTKYRLRTQNGVRVATYLGNRRTEMWELPDSINESDSNTGMKYRFCMNGYKTVAYNIFSAHEFDDFKRISLLEKNSDKVRMGAANMLFECFDAVAAIMSEYDTVYMTHDEVIFEDRPEPLDEGLDEAKLTFDVPCEYVYTGHYIDAYAKDLKSKPYICSCNKKAIENKIRVYERYLQYDTQVKDRNLLLLEHLGLPEHYENIIKNSGEPWSLEWMKYLEFQDELCPTCNKAIIRAPHAYTKYPSKFEQRYGDEYERKYNMLGISNYLPDFFGYYCIEECVPDEIKKIILPTDEELIHEICEETGYSEQQVIRELKKLHELPAGYEDIVKGGHIINKAKKQSYDIEKEYGLDSDFVAALQKRIKKRYQIIRKMVKDEIVSEAKAADNNVETGGSKMEVEINMYGIHYTFLLDKNTREMEVINHNSKKKSETKVLENHEVCNLLSVLDFNHIREEAEENLPRNYMWKVKGNSGKICYVGIAPSRRVIRFWNYVATSVFELEAKKK